MLLCGVFACFFALAGVLGEKGIPDGHEEPADFARPRTHLRRKVKQIKPHWVVQHEKSEFRAGPLDHSDVSYLNNDQSGVITYASYDGTPPWNYGNQGGQGGSSSYPTPDGSYNQGSQFGTGSGNNQYPSNQVNPGYPQPSYPQGPSGSNQPGYPQRPQPGYPQRPQPGYPQRPSPGTGSQRPPQTGQPGQPGKPQRPGFPGSQQPGYPQQPGSQPSQPGYPQQPGSQPSQPGYPQQGGSFQNPSPPGVYPGSPFYPQIQPGLTGPPEQGSNHELLKYCKGERGQFAVDFSCNKFVNCWDGVAFEQDCEGNLAFNEEHSYCDYPENVNCGNRPVTAVASTSLTNSNCSTPFETYRSQTNCGEFFVCSHGVPHRFLCPGGLAYNTDLGICDYAYRVECNGVPLLPVEESTDYENGNETDNADNQSLNENYYGSVGGSGSRPYGRAKVLDEENSLDLDEIA